MASVIDSGSFVLELPYPPSVNRYFRMFRNRIVTSAEAREYKAQAGWLARERGLHAPLDGPVALRAFLHPRATKMKSKAVMPRCIDLDNALKVALDAMNGIVYEDDRQIAEIHITREKPMPGGRLFVQVRAA